jgi:hypothetical protein
MKSAYIFIEAFSRVVKSGGGTSGIIGTISAYQMRGGAHMGVGVSEGSGWPRGGVN